ncbi:CusA/CzcA family heavy metal efflux RND transporter [Chitinophaga sp. XS-30]|uniref:CusA/CzcA family heavy metal efflux RND transporter n=1 Tax=Chitinophaga sp. XS-30 TaxID=2604421 RepID=UPI0011DD7D13|nr:CusA/CzcA family heavy metal efflux RND transporter [Chitinophaga sp. XS-30]QEH42126.1 CusA/CzcA family heavy metal efflux RND transporter [Chitinophaga sp. XS-30]
MLDKIIRFSIYNKLIIGLFTLALMAWGLYSLSRLPIDAVPDITNNQVQVITQSPSLAPQEVERFITFPVEQTLAIIPELKEIRSTSRFGLSVVTVIFHDDVDIYWARQQVNEKLGEAESRIPAGIGKPEMTPVSTGLGEIYQYVIHPQPGYEAKYDAMELRSIQDWIIRQQLLGTPGVAEVNSFGGLLKQYEIALDPDKLRSFRLGINEVFTALERNNQNTGGAYIDKKPNAWFIRSEGLIQSLDDIGRIAVTQTTQGFPVLIRDIAEVRFGQAVRYGALTRAEGKNRGEAVGGVVMMLKGQNAGQVVNRVEERMKQIRQSLPEGVELEVYLNRSDLVGRAIGTVSKNLIEGALIVIFVLVIFLGNFRAGLIVASVIPLAMLFAISMMNLFGVSGNLMSLGAIDFGLIVDGAVIIVEATMHHLGLRKLHRFSQQEMNEEVYLSASRIRTSAAFGEIIILVVYLPILALTGIEGKMFRPMAQTVSFAILGAFILSLTYVPMMSALFLSKRTSGKPGFSDRMMHFFQRLYHPVIQGALRHKLIVVLTAVLLFIAAVITFLRLGGEFIPTLEEGDLAIEMRLTTGRSLQESIDKINLASDLLLKNFPEVKEVVGKVGSAEIPTDPMPMEAVDVMIVMKDKSEWTSASSREELVNKMQETLEAIPGVNFGFSQPIQLRFNELISGVRQDVGVKIFGEDLGTLTRLSEQVGRIITATEGAEDLYLEKITGLPQIVIRLNREMLARYGMDVNTVNQAINAAFAGQSAGLVYEGERRYDLVVRFSKVNRQSIEDVKNVYISAPDGHQVPLDQLADIRYEPGPAQIQREAAKRRIIAGFNVRGRDIESVVEEVQEKIGQGIKLPPGYFITYGGQFENLREAETRLSIAVPIALALIFLLLYFTFRSIKHSLLIFTAIPMATIGGVLALLLRGMPFSISAGIGFIALFGVAVLNGIVLIAEFNRLKKEGMTDLEAIVLEGTKIRLRPVLMTATVASLGFLPMALSNTAGAEVQKPLASVVIGGLLTSTLLTLLVLPVLYIYVEKIRPKVRPAVIASLLMLMCSLPASAQEERYSLDSCIHIALRQNRQMMAAQADVDASRQMRATATDIGKTNVMLQYGQYNSYVKTDNNISIMQSIPFPTLFGAQARLADAGVKGSELQMAAGKNELIYQVKAAWHQLLYLHALEQKLQDQDSIFSRFASAAAVKLRTGESTLLEKTTAESQLQQLRTQLQQVKADIRLYQARLQTLMHAEAPVQITEAPLEELPFTTGNTSGNPGLQWYRQQALIAGQQQKVEKNRLLPDITVGFFTQTLTGAPLHAGNAPAAGAGNRFNGLEAGLAIPLWFKPQSAKIKAARLHRQAAEYRYQLQQKNYEGRYNEQLQQIAKFRESLQQYRNSLIPQADLMITQATKAYRSGEIGYVEYLQSLRTASEIQNDHLLVLNNYNQSMLQLQYLSGNKSE